MIVGVYVWSAGRAGAWAGGNRRWGKNRVGWDLLCPLIHSKDKCVAHTEGLWAQWSGNSAGLRSQTVVALGPKRYSMWRGWGERFPSPLKNIYLYISLCQILVAACEIFSSGMWGLVPWLGIEPGTPALGVWSLSHWIIREVPLHLFKECSVTGIWRIPGTQPYWAPQGLAVSKVLGDSRILMGTNSRIRTKPSQDV